MTSQLDLDQGGTFRQWVKAYLGPSIGWVNVPLQNILIITSAGTFTIDPSVSLVEVNVAGSVTVILPSVRGSAGGPQAQPGLYALNPVTVVDIGSHATANPITINPAAGENIMGLSSIQIVADNGAFTLAPSQDQLGWNSISP
jgi:hypothetical protein